MTYSVQDSGIILLKRHGKNGKRCMKCGKNYQTFRLMRDNTDYKTCMNYMNFALEIQSMIYTTNWIECLNRDFRKATRTRTTMPD